MLGMRNLPQGHTKSALTGRKMLAKADSFPFGGLLKDCKLNIICADDVFYNLEALRIVLARMGLLDYCDFVDNG